MKKVNQLSTLPRASAAAIAAFAIAGCGGNAASPQGAVTIVQPSKSTLQLAVGTANLFGTSTGLNVVTTLRTTLGKSVLVSTPTLTGPFVLPATPGTENSLGATIATGPSAGEINAGGIISGHVQVPAGTPASQLNATTFGTRGGVFAGGFQPSNANDRGSVNGDGSVFNTPYYQPNYNNADADGFSPVGGPPAFDPNNTGHGTRDGTFGPGILGLNEGINAFEGVTVKAGTYNESVLIPSNGTAQTTLSTSFTLATPVLLGTLPMPTYVPDGAGGGTVAVTLPAGVTDGILNFVDYGPDFVADQVTADPTITQPLNCYTNGSYPAYFSIHVTGSGTYTLPDTDGVGTPTSRNPTICTAAENTAANGGTMTSGDSYTVQLVGTDYPIYASNYLFNLTTPNPTITGGAGADDITISPLGGSADFFAPAAGFRTKSAARSAAYSKAARV